MATQGPSSITQGTFVSHDSETAGFDLSSGTKWIYPENYPRRDYQFSIVQSALYNNTLVCLPTGLGKTFIAAVVMYNFWRWYPRGRVVFLAPTKPLVAQQIEACHHIMGIPSEETIELTGAINQVKRQQAWTQKRVIFATPQTFQKDIQNDRVPCELIKCIVIDEAHKALGKHSYCEIVRMLTEKNKFFRILALSATPGSKIDHVREVIQNLLISELELRDDSSPDITPYTNDRSMERIIVHLDKDLNDYKQRYIGIMDPHVRTLAKNHILQGNTANISKGRIFMLMRQYESRPQKANNHGVIMKTLNILLTMYHAYELLIKHGLRAFYNFYTSHSDKFWLEAELDLNLMLEDIKRYIGEFPIIQPLPDGTIPDIPDGLIFGHSKFNKLRELLEDHFSSFARQNKSTRAIVFVEYRDIVNEVYVLLLQKRPLIRPQMFVGQAGQKQKDQLAALEDFRNNKVNVLISTSVGEEGLDVGEVDLIVCFDISSSTPTRLVQRMGRTGRKRSGRVVILLTEGKEVQTLNAALSKKDSLNNRVLQSSNITSSLYQSSPRMVPAHLTPECLPMFIKALPKTPKAKKGKKTKEPAEKKPRKKRKEISPENKPPQASTSKTLKDNASKLPSGTQSLMMKFLTQEHQQKRPPLNFNESDSGISEEFQNRDIVASENPYAMIKPSEIKLLTSDSHGLEFLTLCAMKESEKCEPDVIEVDTTWIPKHSPPSESWLDFNVPSLDNLNFIKDLKPYVAPVEEDHSDRESVCIILSDEDHDNVHNFETSRIESKYANKKQELVEPLESRFFNDISTFETRPFDEINNKSQNNVEILSADFDSDFSVSDSKPIPSEKSQKQNPVIDTFNQTSKKSDLKSFLSTVPGPSTSQSKSNLSVSKNQQCLLEDAIMNMPAQVEVDFDEILDEQEEEVSHQLSDEAINKTSTRVEVDFDKILDEEEQEEDFQQLSEETIKKIPSRIEVDFDKILDEEEEEENITHELSEERIKKIPAQVEVDFDEILNESSASEKSESQSLVGSDANIFQNLLDEDSEEDLFQDDPQNTTVIFNENVVNSTRLSFKRSASRSPHREDTAIKKQRVSDVDSSDTDSFVDIPGTPQKAKKRASLVNDEVAEKVVEQNCTDSDQDLFDDIEFETQFEINKLEVKDKDKTIVPCENNESSFEVSKNQSLEKDEDKTMISHHQDESLLDNKEDETFFEDDTLVEKNEQALSKNKNQSSFERNKNDVYKSCFGTEKKTDEFEKHNSSYLNKDLILDDQSIFESDKAPADTSSKLHKFVEKDSSNKLTEEKKSIANIPDDLVLDDWDIDDLDFAPVTSKTKTEQERVSSFFSSSKPIQSTSSGWITVGKSQPKKALSLKNLNFPNNCSKPGNHNPKILTAQIRPNRLLSLKRNHPETDKDGFAMPQSKATKVSAVPNEFTKPNVSERTCRDKENNRPNWKRRKDNSISPRFRKYHSNNELFSKKPKKERRKKARRRIAHQFIEDEAEISDDVETSAGSSAEDDEDDNLGNFVSYTQDVHEDVDMTMHYLQSVNKTPIRHGAFIMRPPRNPVPRHEIFSQPVSQVEDTYLHDSFCVGDETQMTLRGSSDESASNQSSDESVSNDSTLENLESALESRRRIMREKRLEKRNKFKCLGNNKKRIKNRTNDSSSSEDEIEALRKQLREEP